VRNQEEEFFGNGDTEVIDPTRVQHEFYFNLRRKIRSSMNMPVVGHSASLKQKQIGRFLNTIVKDSLETVA
jgi:hypothetical protein